MTENLHAKFTGLESQLSAYHLELMDALNSIAFALGAPPSAPTITLADVVDALAAGNALLAAGNDNTAAILAELNTDLASINLLLDTINSNNSSNAQLIYGAILQTACACDVDAPLLEPPLIVSPTPLAEDEKCARIQYYLSIFGALIDNIANFGGAGATITGATIAELLFAAVTAGGLTGGEVGALGGPPGIVLGAIVGIIAAIVGALGSAYLFQLSSQWHQSPLPEQLLAALYAANSADEGNDAFFNVIDASEVLNTPFKPLIIALFWNGWSNDIYSDTPIIDASAFDSSICAPPEDCPTFTTTDYGSHWVIDWTETAPTYNYDGDWFGYTVRLTAPYTPPSGSGVARLYMYETPTYGSPADIPQFDLTETAQVITSHTVFIQSNAFKAGTEGLSYTIELCPPS